MKGRGRNLKSTLKWLAVHPLTTHNLNKVNRQIQISSQATVKRYRLCGSCHNGRPNRRFGAEHRNHGVGA